MTVRPHDGPIRGQLTLFLPGTGVFIILCNTDTKVQMLAFHENWDAGQHAYSVSLLLLSRLLIFRDCLYAGYAMLEAHNASKSMRCSQAWHLL